MTAGQPQRAASPPSRWLVLAVICTAVLTLQLDTTIVNVAQVKIAAALGAGLGQLQWILDAYLLTYAALLLGLGRLGDLVDRRRLFVLGLTLFTVTSALCAASATIGHRLGISGASALVLSRLLQGIGAAAVTAQSLALVGVVFPPDERGTAMGIWSGTMALGAVLGPILGGSIVAYASWHWIFLINVPVGLVAIPAALKILPASARPPASARFDWAGLLLSAAGLGALVDALIAAGRDDWGSRGVLGPAAGGAALLGFFGWREIRTPSPVMPLALWRRRNYWVGSATAAIASFSMLGSFFLFTLYLQVASGFSPLRAAVALSPAPITILLAAPLVGRLSDRIGARAPIILGFALVTAGVGLAQQRIDGVATGRTLLPALLLMGAGMAAISAPATAAAMKEVPPALAGAGSGLLTTMRSLGQLLGIAVLGSLLRQQAGTHVADRLARTALEPGAQHQVLALAREGRFAAVSRAVPAAERAAVLAAVRGGFAAGVRDALVAAVLTGLLGLALAPLIRNRPTPADTPDRRREAAPPAPLDRWALLTRDEA